MGVSKLPSLLIVLSRDAQSTINAGLPNYMLSFRCLLDLCTPTPLRQKLYIFHNGPGDRQIAYSQGGAPNQSRGFES